METPEAVDSLLDAFSLREPVPTSPENALTSVFEQFAASGKPNPLIQPNFFRLQAIGAPLAWRRVHGALPTGRAALLAVPAVIGISFMPGTSRRGPNRQLWEWV
jgi:hypothetical protein